MNEFTEENKQASTNPDSWQKNNFKVETTQSKQNTGDSVTFDTDSTTKWVIVGFDLIVCNDNNSSNRKRKTPQNILINAMNKQNVFIQIMTIKIIGMVGKFMSLALINMLKNYIFIIKKIRKIIWLNS